MKRRFSKILGVGLTLALLCSLLLTAAPVSADVSQPTVADISNEDISATATYTLNFRINTELLDTMAAGLETPATTADTITVRFPEDTNVDDAAVLTDGVSFTSGIGWEAGESVNVTVVPDEDDPIVVITLNDLGATETDGDGIGAMAYVQVVISGIINPTDPGTYTLEVKTSEEDTYVESEEYDIDAPTIGGFVDVYNSANVKLATFGGRDALNDAQGVPDYYAGDDYTIRVGEGTYDVTSPIVITGKGLTLESSEGADDTIIDATDVVGDTPIKINADDVTVDGFTVDGSPYDGIKIHEGTTGVTVKNNIITDAVRSGIMLDDLRIDAENNHLVVAEATVSGNVIEDCGAGINLLGNALDCTISDNTITGSGNESLDIHGGTANDPTKGNTITGNTITANDCMGIRIKAAVPGSDNGGPVFVDNVIEGNTISENDEDGILIMVEGDGEADLSITGLEILDNDIIDNEGDGIQIADAVTGDIAVWGVGTDAAGYVVSNTIKFNTITGNGDDGINNLDSAVDVDATFNWWGTTVADDIGDMVSADVTYEPFLTDTAEAVIAGGKAAANTSSLDAKDEAGVKVSGVDDGTDGDSKVADIISAIKYIANPEEAIDDAIGFYDVFVVLEEGFVLDDVAAKLKFYDSAITTGSVANFWTGDFWAECSDFEARDGIIYVTISDDTLPALDELEETIFAVVAGEAVTALGAPTLLAPAVGADDVSLTPTFAWGAVAGAIGYDFEMADNTLFVMPMVSLTGELGRLIVTAYAYVGELPYSNAYYWRVRAVSADEESDWASGVFITMGEPVEPTPPVVIEPYEPPEIIIEQPDIIIESPDVIVPLPAETPITPAWIYVIIGVGAVLVIALLVLIVRTRRVA